MSGETTGNRKDYALDAYPIGSGGFADVHAAKQKSTGRRVAFKKLRDGVRHAKERFEREIAVMRQLSHANIMPLLDADENGQWYVMPLADDCLTNLVRGLDEASLEECFLQVAAGLAHAHDAGLVHRDVTPNNILRIRDLAGVRWVVADWGLVRRPPGETGDFATKGGLGTEGFAAPETWTVGHDVDRRADIYGLGRVIAWALTRHPPVPNVDLPAPGKWRALVAKMTAHERTARYEDLTAVVTQLNALRGSVSSGQLIALGPEVVAEGELIEVAGRDWSIDLHRLVIGNERALLRFSDTFDELSSHDRFVTFERDGEARALASAPRLARKGDGWSLRVTLGPRHERPHVDSIGSGISIDDLRTLRGRERLPQIFLIALSTARGELLGSPDWGSDLRQRFAELGDVELFERLVGLEAMRMASIPYADRDGSSATPLRCVDRIVSLKLSPGRDADHRRAHVVAEVNGIGRWEEDIEILVVSAPPAQTAHEVMGDLKASLLAKGTGRAASASAKPATAATRTPVASPFMAPVATLTSKAGMPVEPLLWLFSAKLVSHSPRTKTELHDALMGSLVEQDADFQRRTRWPRLLRLSEVQVESAAVGTLWRFAYRTGAANEAGDEQLMMYRDGSLSFQRAMFWDVEAPGLDFGALAFDCTVFMKFAGRYAAKLGASSLTIDLRVSTPRGAKELLAMFTTQPANAEQPDRVGRLRHPLTQTNVGTISLPAAKVNDTEVAQSAKRLLDGIANEFELESSAFSSGGPPFLAIDVNSLAALARGLR